ncbi:MAG: hypothetical protein Lokiarch_38500, partial [Candidatus Lokiarchaeum sp. GC14_75]
MRIDNRASRIRSLLFLLIIVAFFPLIASYTDNIFTNKYESDYNDPQQVKTAILGNDPWWDSDWPYRILINVTNQESVDLKNYGVSIDFPYDDAEYIGKVNNTLKDIRIIEYASGVAYERKYYIFQDYPSTGEARIFFNTNVSASGSETDTYLYFGNMGVASTAVEDGLGYVKNGDFEYFPSGDTPTVSPYDPVGWNWSHNPPEDLIPAWGLIPNDPYTTTETVPIAYWQNALVNITSGHVRNVGYTYKWGTTEINLPAKRKDILRADDNYAGVVYSNSFVVPIVGNGDPSVDTIFLNLWRNVRVCSFDLEDGYFVRIINASAGLSNPDNHQVIGSPGYFEYFTGVGATNQGHTLANYSQGGSTSSGTVETLGVEEGLFGEIKLNLSNYMGMNVSLEVGMFGDEGIGGSDDVGFGQIDNVYFDYTVDTALNELQSQQSQIIIITRDVDGNIVPSAEVSIIQDGSVIDTQTTDDTGECTFSNINYGIYNFTVNYTFAPGVEQVVFNSTEANFGTSLWNTYNASNLDESFDLYLDIWTMDFEIVDWDDELLDDGYGNVKIYDDKGGTLLKELPLVNGTARFRWNNASFYYYEVSFNNTDYNSDYNNFLLNSSYIYRSDYVLNKKYYDHALPLATYDQNPGGNYYRVYERIYTNGSLTDFSTKKLINFNITLENMLDQIDNMTIYYIDKYNQTVGNEIYQNLTMSGTDFFKSIDIRSIDNDKLKSENYEAYGILIDVQGFRNGAHTGVIKINTSE